MNFYLIFLTILLFFARLTEDIFAKFGISSVIGEMFVSIGVTVRVLENIGKIKEDFAQVVLGAAGDSHGKA